MYWQYRGPLIVAPHAVLSQKTRGPLMLPYIHPQTIIVSSFRNLGTRHAFKYSSFGSRVTHVFLAKPPMLKALSAVQITLRKSATCQSCTVCAHSYLLFFALSVKKGLTRATRRW